MAMPQRTHLQAEILARETRRGKWRFLLRNLYFRIDLNRFRHELHSGSQRATEIADRTAFPPGIFSAKTPDLSADSIPTYEAPFAPDGNYGDPEELWRLIRPDAAALPTLTLGSRLRLDKVDFYCKVYDLHVKGVQTKMIGQTLNKPLPTVKSALSKAKEIIEIKPEESVFNPTDHQATCSICQTGQMCKEYEHAFQEFRRSLRLERAKEDLPDDWRYKSRGSAQNLYEEENIDRTFDHPSDADSQPEEDSDNDLFF